MTESLIVVGAGGFGREVLDVVEAINVFAGRLVWDVSGVVDENPSDANRERLKARGVRLLGTLTDLHSAGDASCVAVGVGSPAVRARIVHQLDRLGRSSPTLVHPTAVIGTRTVLGSGTIVCGHVSIGTNVTLGRHVHLNPHAVVGHDADVGDCVSVNPNATVSGDCVIEDRVLVGAAAVVLQGVRVGADATVGAAACVVADAASNATLVGVPARPMTKAVER